MGVTSQEKQPVLLPPSVYTNSSKMLSVQDSCRDLDLNLPTNMLVWFVRQQYQDHAEHRNMYM